MSIFWNRYFILFLLNLITICCAERIRVLVNVPVGYLGCVGRETFPPEDAGGSTLGCHGYEDDSGWIAK